MYNFFSVMKGHKITFSGKFSVSQKQIQELALAHGAQLGKHLCSPYDKGQIKEDVKFKEDVKY